MVNQIKEHQLFIEKALKNTSNKTNYVDVINYHKRHIDYFQSERLIHLLVTLAVGLFLLIAVALTLLTHSLGLVVISLALLVLFAFYIIHYYKLENGIQNLYKFDKKLFEKIKK